MIDYEAAVRQYDLPDRLKGELARLFKTHATEPARPRRTAKPLSYQTAYRRLVNLCASLRELHELGYRIQSLDNLGERHVRVLVEYWEEKGQDFGTIDNKVSYFRTLACWLGKRNMIEAARAYMADKSKANRKRIAEVDKSWEAAGVDLFEMIERIRAEDPYVAATLELVAATKGGRMREASLLRIRKSLDSAVTEFTVPLEEGTKAHRPRVIPVTETAQIAILARALPLANRKTGTIIPLKYATFEQWRGHFYYVLRKYGITKKDLGVTFHGIRHQVLQGIFEEITGKPAPVKGGSGFDPDLYELALRKVVEIAGHNDKYKSAAYLGQIIPLNRLRKAVEEEVARLRPQRDRDGRGTSGGTAA